MYLLDIWQWGRPNLYMIKYYSSGELQAISGFRGMESAMLQDLLQQ